jgi:hypothetical protein
MAVLALVAVVAGPALELEAELFGVRHAGKHAQLLVDDPGCRVALSEYRVCSGSGAVITSEACGKRMKLCDVNSTSLQEQTHSVKRQTRCRRCAYPLHVPLDSGVRWAGFRY